MQVIEINGKRLAILGVTSEVALEVAKAIGNVSNQTVVMTEVNPIEKLLQDASKFIVEVGHERKEQSSYHENLRKYLKRQYR